MTCNIFKYPFLLGLLSRDCGSDDEAEDLTNSGATVGLSDESQHDSITPNAFKTLKIDIDPKVLNLEDTNKSVSTSVLRISDSVEEPDEKLAQCSQSKIKDVISTVITTKANLQLSNSSTHIRQSSISRGTSPITELLLTNKVQEIRLHPPPAKQVKGGNSLESSSSVSSWKSSNSSWSSLSSTKLNSEETVTRRPNSLDLSNKCITTDL
jgi:hypothetical protein